MHLTDVERDKLLLTYAAEMAWRRRGRGLKLNHPAHASRTRSLYRPTTGGRLRLADTESIVGRDLCLARLRALVDAHGRVWDVRAAALAIAGVRSP